MQELLGDTLAIDCRVWRPARLDTACINGLPATLSFERRDCLCPAILTRGSDQMPLSTKFDMRDDPNVVRNYGRMLVELASVIPDGIVAFFVSYSYMDTIVSKWDQMGVLQVTPQLHPVYVSPCT